MDSLINIGIYITYILFAIAILALIVFPFYFMFTNFKKAKGGLLSILGLVVIFVLSYLVAPADQGVFYENFGIGPGASKLIGGGLILTYLIFFGVIITAFYNEIAKWFK